MKELLQKSKVLLVAASLCAGTTGAWADITTKTYDFTSWVKEESTQLVLGTTNVGSAFRQNTYYCTNFDGEDYFNNNFGFRNKEAYLSPEGLKLSKDNFMTVLNLTAGDKIAITYTSGTVKIIHNQSGNTPSSSSLTLDGREIVGDNSVVLTSGQTYYDFRDSRIAVRATTEAVVTSVTIKHNDSKNYALLFEQWKRAVAKYYSGDGTTASKASLKTAIDAAKVVIDADETPADDYADAYTAITAASKQYEIANGTYYVYSDDVITSGTEIDMPGCKLVYGGTESNTWTVATPSGNQAISGYSYRVACNQRALQSNSYVDKMGGTVSVGQLPTQGGFFKFVTTQNGTLTVAAQYFKGDYYFVDESDKKIVWKESFGYNSYTTRDIKVAAGKTYYFYTTANNATGLYGYKFSATDSEEITIGETGFATYASKFNLDFKNSEIKAYTASLTEDKTVLLTRVTGAVPAGTGLILAGTTGNVPTAIEASAPQTNLLVGLYVDVTLSASASGSYNYVLAKSDTKPVGFYNLAAEKKMSAGKAYLHTTEALAESAESARVAWSFDDEQTTGILNVDDGRRSVEAGVYDLQGRRVERSILKKGLYIVNGKKVIK